MTSKTLFRAAALAAVLVLMGALAAEARRMGGGSRGMRTYAPPPVTQTAPNPAGPLQRTTTTPAPGMRQPAAPQRPAPTPAAQQGSRFGGLGMGLAAGFLGAGLFGLLSGQGFLAGLGSFLGFLGFVLQIALIAGLIWLAFRFLRGRREAAGGPAPAHARMGSGAPRGGGYGPLPGMAGGSVAAPSAAPSDAIGVTARDFDRFEEMLGEVEDAYSREDLAALRTLATPEMASYFADDLKANAAKGVVNRISNVRLLQGDLSEAWREPDADYATVAMRFSLVDVTVDRATGRVVDGDPRGEEVTELWTFRRPHGGTWQVSAIQPA